MKSVILGTAGHVDHGKTALIEALTGINTDRWEEERRRGITIDLGFAPFPSGSADLAISVVDVPGHEDFVKNMLAGATGVDILLLVVAADEGPMPQTHEHLWIARTLGVQHGVAAVTKADLVDSEWRELVTDSVRDEITRVFGEHDWPVLSTSAVSRQGLDGLKDALVEAAGRVPARRDDDLFRMPVDRSFTVRGVGTVATGTVWSGAVDVGAEVEVLPAGHRVRVRGVQAHGDDVSRASAGQRAALALVGIGRSEVRRGDVLTVDPVWRSSYYIDVELHLIPDSPWPIKNWQRVRFHLGTAEAMARVVLYESDRLEPGATGLAQLRTEQPIVARAGDRFVLRFYSPVTTIGGGLVIDPWAKRRSRLAPRVADALRAGASLPPSDRVVQAVAVRSIGASELDLAVTAGVNRADLRKNLRSLADAGALREVGELWFTTETARSASEAVVAALTDGHARDSGAPGVSLESLRSALGYPVELINAVLSDLQRRGLIRVDRSWAALPDHVPSLRPHQQRLAEAARARIETAGLTPPAVSELAKEMSVAAEYLIPVLKFMAERGDLVPVTPDLYFDTQALLGARDRLRTLLAGGRAAAPSELREGLGVSRKYLIPLLEHLDAVGFTRRTPQGRVLKEPL